MTITAEVTPVQTATSALTKNITGDTLVSVQVKGRDIFGMMKILPGVVDTTASRDFAQWNSGRGLSINGGNSLNKNTTIDGVPVGEEGGDGTTHITPNIDSIGEVNVITSGYTAENGRQSSGLISIVTKSGTNQFRGIGLVQRAPRRVEQERLLPHPAEVAKPFFEVNIGGYSIGGPVIIPGVMNSRTSQKKVYFFLSQEFTQDLRPADVSRTQPADRARAQRATSRRPSRGRPRAPLTARSSPAFGRLRRSSTRRRARPFAGTKIPGEPHEPAGPGDVYLLPLPNGVHDPSTDNFNNSNDAQDKTPLHDRTNFVSRVDVVLSQNIRFSGKALFDRDNSIAYNRVAPGIGENNNVFPGDLMTGALSQVLGPSMVNEVTLGFSPQSLRLSDRQGQREPGRLHRVLSGEHGQPGHRPEGPVSAHGRNLRPLRGHRLQPPEQGRVAVHARHAATRAATGPTCPPGGRGGGQSRLAMTWNENYRYTFQDDLSWTRAAGTT